MSGSAPLLLAGGDCLAFWGMGYRLVVRRSLPSTKPSKRLLLALTAFRARAQPTSQQSASPSCATENPSNVYDRHSRRRAIALYRFSWC